MKKKDKTTVQSNAIDTLEGYGRLAYYRAKVCWAGWLEQKAAAMPQKQLYLLLVLFTALCAGYFSFLIFEGFTGSAKKAVAVTAISTIAPPKPNRAIPIQISPQEYHRIIAFRAYLDSLRNFDSKHYKSLLDARPGLIDSLRQVEHYYESNTTQNNGKK